MWLLCAIPNEIEEKVVSPDLHFQKSFAVVDKDVGLAMMRIGRLDVRIKKGMDVYGREHRLFPHTRTTVI